MRCIHSIPSLETEASGVTAVLLPMCRSMLRAGCEVRLATVDINGVSSTEPFVRSFECSGPPRQIGRSASMHRWLKAELGTGGIDIVHSHGLWMMPNVYPGWAAKKSSASLVVSPHGTLSEWALDRSRLKKKVVWHALQRAAISNAALFHATSEDEYRGIRRLGFRQPITVIPNGVAIPSLTPESRRTTRRSLLFLGRIHPVKGIENLFRAWALLEGRFTDWDLTIIGPGDEAYVAELNRLGASLGLKRALFQGPRYGAEKSAAFRSADLFVLPTHSENFGMAVAEALAAGRPVVTTKGAPWSGLVEHRAGWWVDIGVEPLRQALEEAMSKQPGALADMGARGRACWFMGRPLPVTQIILRGWRTGTCRFSDVLVNEYPLVEGSVAAVGGFLEHHDSPDLHHWFDKQNRYSTAEALSVYRGDALAAAPRLLGSQLERRMWLKSKLMHMPLRSLLVFLHCYIGQSAWRAGRIGYIWSRLRVDVYRMRSLKLLEMKLKDMKVHK